MWPRRANVAAIVIGSGTLINRVARAVLTVTTVLTGACDQRSEPSSDHGRGGAATSGAGGGAALGAKGGTTASAGSSSSGGLPGAGASATGDDIPVRYLMLASSDRAAWESRFPAWVDCTDAMISENQAARCMPGATLERFNDDFDTLTSTRPFRRSSFEVVEHSPFASLLTQAGEVDVCGAGTVTSALDGSTMDASTFAVPGALTVIVVEDIEDPVGGFARADQPINPSVGGWIVVEALAPLYAFEHEVGHVFGLEHFLYARQTYEHCGGMTADPSAEKSGCTCEFNVMGLLLWTTDPGCTCGVDVVRTFDTPLAADFTRHVARCWLEERRHRQECIVEYAEGSTICSGTEGNLTCHCPDAQSTFTTQSCSPAAADQMRADAIAHCSKECFPADGGSSYPRCQGSPYEVTCECSEGGPTFTVPGCSEAYADLVSARATEGCGVARCTSAKVPGVVCEGIAYDTIPCTCPNGAQFQTASDCSVLDLFVEGFCAE